MASGTDSGNITIEPLDQHNYGTWSQRMQCVLIHKGLWSAIELTTEGTTTREQASTAISISQKALALIGLNVKDHHLPTVMSCTTAKEAWDKLAAIYKSKTNARRLQLRQELATLKMEAPETVSKYFSRGKTLWQDLLATGHKVSETEIAWNLLAGLPKNYSIVKAILTSSDDELELDKVMSRLLIVERELQIHEEELTPSSKVLTANAMIVQKSKECYYCGKKGHLKAQCWKRERDEKARNNKAVVAVAL